jgi:hypothetical protein
MVDVNTTPVCEAVIVPFAVFLDYKARRRAATPEPAPQAAIAVDAVDIVDIEGVRV